MRRLLMLVLLCMFVIPAAAFAQDATPAATGQPKWDLSQLFKVSDLGFTFNYPTDWVTDSTSGIKLAENQDDLNLLLDTDPATHPAGYSISVTGAPLSALSLAADAKLDDVVEALVTASGLTETEPRFDFPIMSRRSVAIVGTNKDGVPGIANVWIQDGNVIALALSGPTLDADAEFSWGMILASILPVDALEMGDTPVASPNGDFTMSYPKDWFTSPDQPGAVAELEEDFSSGTTTPKGTAVVMAQIKLSDLNKDVTDLASLATYIRNSEGWDDTVIPSEHIVLGQPALTFAAPNPKAEGTYAIVTVAVQDDTALIIGAFIPTEDAFTAFWPTYLTMLKSITATPAAS